jgi:hypothetical protein
MQKTATLEKEFKRLVPNIHELTLNNMARLRPPALPRAD